MKTIRQVTEMMNVSRRTVERWIASGEMRTVDVCGIRGAVRKRHRITDEELAIFKLRRSPQKTLPAKREQRVNDDKILQIF